MKKITLSLALLLLAGCVNPYTYYYTSYISDPLPPDLEISNSEPEIIKGSDIEQDQVRMLEEGFIPLGQSHFISDSASSAQAIEQAKKIKASKVLLYQEYEGTQSGVLPLTTPTINNSTTQHNGNIRGNGGYANYSGTSTTTTYGQQTTYIPYSIENYKYLATYWIRRTYFRLGAHSLELSADERAAIMSNIGVKVVAVVKKSPAFYADIFRGDIIKSIAGRKITSIEDMVAALDESSGKDIDIEILRNGVLIVKKVRIS
ncbi:hypothetical protein WP8S17C03_08390 [Metapseudomonas otitidis]|uniref:PDZ domain-containing protein n=1 Tax=Metapseudomonas otitidis TaxID=319939 RepID=A0A6S5RJM3_9GAMM|nr:PDZ domain-containing protein [Pseudomonas otitidis]BBT14790.1 hypothetical protein WP8S17C03_08390 [Pseudomonas otitidis]